MIFSKTSKRFSAVLGIPKSSFSSAATSRPLSFASVGKASSSFAPSKDTEFNSPGLL